MYILHCGDEVVISLRYALYIHTYICIYNIHVYISIYIFICMIYSMYDQFFLIDRTTARLCNITKSTNDYEYRELQPSHIRL